jgi:hypothetical protein
LSPESEPRLAFGAFELDLAHRDLRKHGAVVPLHATQRCIATERGRGYRWIAPIEVCSPAARAANARLADLPAPAPRERRLAVLPFKSLTADRDDQYFADGVTEDIVAQVSKLRGSRSCRAPRARASSAAQKASGRSPASSRWATWSRAACAARDAAYAS